MKHFVACYLFIAICVPNLGATAQAAPVNQKESRAEKLDTLFNDLRRATTERDAKRISGRIWSTWYESGSESIDLMMGWAQKAIDGEKYVVALDFLDQIVTLAPEFAEGWNRRATVHFMMNNYAKSMSDIDRTLRLEPRHFGALSGMGMILKNTGRKDRALDAYLKVLEHYPMMRSAQKQVIDLSEELAGEGI